MVDIILNLIIRVSFWSGDLGDSGGTIGVTVVVLESELGGYL